jgi:hypothetical protein
MEGYYLSQGICGYWSKIDFKSLVEGERLEIGSSTEKLLLDSL